jgi:hypothetical protein
MSLHPPYYFLDFWILVIIGLAVVALARSRRRRRRSRDRAGTKAANR